MDMKAIYSIAKKEFLDNWRNKWIIAVAAIFLVLTLVVSYFGTAHTGDTGWKDVDDTIAIMMSIVTFLLPIIGLMLGYASIVGERERGSLSLLLSYPVRRHDVIAGKFVGLSAVLSVATAVGFGVSGIIIGLNVKDVHWAEYGIFILSSFLLGFVYIALAIMFSSILAKRSTALGASVFLWFLFAIIWGIVLVGLLVTQYSFSEITQDDWTGPNWYYLASIINPNSAFQIMVALSISSVAADVAGDLPSFYTTPAALLIILLWIIIPLSMAIFVFRTKDL
jgi:Cu-processing system permease protein